MEYTIIIDMVHLLKKYIIDINLDVRVCTYIYAVETYTRNVHTHTR